MYMLQVALPALAYSGRTHANYQLFVSLVKGYSTRSRKRACPGILSPASLRLPASTICLNCSSVILCRPKSISVPTTALTMLRRKRLAVISKYQVPGDVFTHRASVTVQYVDLLSAPALQNAAKSVCLFSNSHPSRMASKSSA